MVVAGSESGLMEDRFGMGNPEVVGSPQVPTLLSSIVGGGGGIPTLCAFCVALGSIVIFKVRLAW